MSALLIQATQNMSTIAAIVPTYNRKLMLKESLKALGRQTRRPDAIFVIDNNGTDGSAETIPLEFPAIRYVRLDHNGGSAGGFRAGMEIAFREGFEWIWLADDDAAPDGDALERLVEASRQMPSAKVFNSLVIQPDRKTINWGYHLYLGNCYQDGVRLIQTVDELESLAQPVVNGLAQFNTGSLIHRDVIEKVGFHEPGLFIRGEEVDYVFRIQRAGFKTYTVVASRYVHPAEQQIRGRFPGRNRWYPVLTPQKQYYCLRNSLINMARYNFRGDNVPLASLRLFLGYVRMSFATDQHFRRLRYTFAALFDAIRGRAIVKEFPA